MTPVLVTYINPWDFVPEDSETGENLKGLTIEYLDLDQDPADHMQKGRKGLQSFRDTLDLDAMGDFQVVPGFYNLSHRRSRDAKGRQVLRVNGGELVAPANLPELLKTALRSPQSKA